MLSNGEIDDISEVCDLCLDAGMNFTDSQRKAVLRVLGLRAAIAMQAEVLEAELGRLRDVLTTVTEDAERLAEVRRHVGARIEQHRANLDLWGSRWLDPTEPDEHERKAVVRELKAALNELRLVEKITDGPSGEA